MLFSLILKLAIFPHLPTMGMDNNTYYIIHHCYIYIYYYILSFITIYYYSLVFIIIHYCTMLYHLREGWKYKTIRGFEAEVINQSQVFNGPSALATARPEATRSRRLRWCLGSLLIALGCTFAGNAAKTAAGLAFAASASVFEPLGGDSDQGQAGRKQGIDGHIFWENVGN